MLQPSCWCLKQSGGGTIAQEGLRGLGFGVRLCSKVVPLKGFPNMALILPVYEPM